MPEGRDSRARSLWLPPAVLVAVAVSAWIIYAETTPSVANVAIPLYGASLIFGPALVYPWLRLRGAAGRTAMAGALLLPVLWVLGECWATSRIFSFWEAAYYAFNPLSLGLFTVAALQMSVAEILFRRARFGHWRIPGAPLWTLFAVAVLAVVVFVAAQRYGVTVVHYAYIGLYRRLFGF